MQMVMGKKDTRTMCTITGGPTRVANRLPVCSPVTGAQTHGEKTQLGSDRPTDLGQTCTALDMWNWFKALLPYPLVCFYQAKV